MAVEDLSITQLKDLKEILEAFIDHSNTNIIETNFIKNFYKYTVDGILYGNYKLFGTKTFRLTSNSPNLLNMPATGSIYAKPLKRCFVVPDGWVLYAVDLSALEDRVIANLSKDKNKCSLFLDGLDGHCLNSYYYFREEIEAELPRGEDEDLTTYIKRYFDAVENGNKVLKAIRQKSKQPTFGMNYGAYPKKLVAYLKCTLADAEAVWNRYHHELYPGVTEYREDYVLPTVKKYGKIHLGLGAYISSSNPEKEIRTLFNATAQFWSIITLLSVDKMHDHIDIMEFDDRVFIISSIYDSIYMLVKEDAELIKWVNDTIIPIITVDFIEDQIIPNEAVGEIGYNWYDTVKISNDASIEEIQEALLKAKEDAINAK